MSMSVPQANSRITSDWPVRARRSCSLRTFDHAQRFLGGLGDEVLDLERRRTFVLGAHCQRRMGQVGQQIDLEARQGNQPKEDEGQVTMPTVTRRRVASSTRLIAQPPWICRRRRRGGVDHLHLGAIAHGVAPDRDDPVPSWRPRALPHIRCRRNRSVQAPLLRSVGTPMSRPSLSALPRSGRGLAGRFAASLASAGFFSAADGAITKTAVWPSSSIRRAARGPPGRPACGRTRPRCGQTCPASGRRVSSRNCG